MDISHTQGDGEERSKEALGASLKHTDQEDRGEGDKMVKSREDIEIQ